MAKIRLSKFDQGYLCAVSNLIGGHGCNTDAWDAFSALGYSLRDVLAIKGLSEYDIENLSQLKSFDPSFHGENA